jgi:hypothetical protein
MTKPPRIADPEYAAGLIAEIVYANKGWTINHIAHALGIRRRKLIELMGRRTRLRYPLQLHMESLLEPARVAQVRANYWDRNRKPLPFWHKYF